MKACLNGGRSRDDHPGVPLAPAQLAAAEAIHLHPRHAGGRESLLAADVAAAVAAVRRACPATPAGMPAGLRITDGDPAARRSAVAAWAGIPPGARPDFASASVSEPGWADLCRVLASAAIAAEAGAWPAADTAQPAAGGPAMEWLRIPAEIIDVPAAGAAAAADEILGCLDQLAVTAPRLLHAEGLTCWPLIAHAGMPGLPARAGLGDTTADPGGSSASGNAELTEPAQRMRAAPATP
jgi:uncharacterized protein (DUF849 family)